MIHRSLPPSDLKPVLYSRHPVIFDTVNLRPRSDSTQVAVVGVVLGIVFMVVILGVLAYMYWWRHISPPPKKSKKGGKKMERRRRRESDERKHRRRDSPRIDHYDTEYDEQPRFVLQLPPVPYRVGIHSYEQDGFDNEMDAPQIAYSDDECGLIGEGSWNTCPHRTAIHSAQGRAYLGRGRSYSSSWP